MDDLSCGGDELAGLLVLARPRRRIWPRWRLGGVEPAALGAMEPFYHPELVDLDYWADARVTGGVEPRAGKDARQMDGSIIFSDGSRSLPDGKGEPAGYWVWNRAYPEGPVVQPDGSIIYADGSRSYPGQAKRDAPGRWPRGGHVYEPPAPVPARVAGTSVGTRGSSARKELVAQLGSHADVTAFLLQTYGAQWRRVLANADDDLMETAWFLLQHNLPMSFPY